MFDWVWVDAVLGGLLLVQFGGGLLFFLTLIRRPQPLDSQPQPRAAVVLCLRGSDPFLGRTLDGLWSQDYPDYEIVVVVDHPSDPALAAVKQFREQQEASAERGPAVRVELLREPLATCSLKCSSLVQAVESLDPQVELVALLDADTIPHRTWLRELAAALADPRVGAATGNRWYIPARPSLAALIRQAWNSAAVVVMYLRGIAWGGTLAIKTSVFRETPLLERWRHAFCEDTMMKRQLRPAGLRVRFVPSLMMINREDCSLKGFYLWVRRQLLAAKLYHPSWPLVTLHGLATSAIPLAVLLLLIGLAVAGQTTAARRLLASLAVYQLALMSLQAPLDWAVRRIAARRGEHPARMSWRGKLLNASAVLLTQGVYGAALVTSHFLKVVDWRGVQYRIRSSWNIELLGYSPYLPPDDAEQHHSL